jgi:hypothetical protein
MRSLGRSIRNLDRSMRNLDRSIRNLDRSIRSLDRSVCNLCQNLSVVSISTKLIVQNKKRHSHIHIYIYIYVFSVVVGEEINLCIFIHFMTFEFVHVSHQICHCKCVNPESDLHLFTLSEPCELHMCTQEPPL